MDGHALLEDLRRIEAPDGRFWHVYQRPGVLAIVVEAATDALPRERYRWRVRGLTHGRAAALHVARALRAGTDPTPDGASLLLHWVDAAALPPTGNVTLV
ncbi:MAG: hypothetical protein ABIM89_09345 [Mycobacteriales bacterium]